MDDQTLPGASFEPEREKLIQGVESLKVYFDPLRLRIIQEVADQARSIPEIAEALNLPFTRLYYHINLLESAGFIKLVDVRRGAGAIEEKYYRVAARLFVVDRSLMTPGTARGDEGLEAVLNTVLDGTRRSIYDGIDAGVLDPAKRTPDPSAIVILRGVFTLTPELAEDFQRRIKELVIDFNSVQVPSQENAREYNLAIVLNPTVLKGDEPSVDVDTAPEG